MLNVKSYKERIFLEDNEILVGIYARVSTEHVEQLNALDNQIQYYEELVQKMPSVKVVDWYVDKGISGTQAKNRPQFQRMIADAKNKKLHLIITREVSRMCRNTKESLEYVNVLKECGVEVYFSSDGIWTLDDQDSFKLGIMSLLAEQESRKTGERVRHGQATSRKNGVIYGNGNLLGYDLVRGKKSIDNTYVINEEQAKVVRKIFKLYVFEGLGMKRIASTLIADGDKDSRGKVKWDVYKISRILRNRTYSGYIGYNKSTTLDSITHKRVLNTEWDTYEYVKGSFPPIISDDVWQRAQKIRSSRNITDNQNKKKGVALPTDTWNQKLVCACGKKFRRYHWRTNEGTGEACFGYQCTNVIVNRSRQYHIDHSLDDLEGLCDMKSIPEWKFNFMFKEIFDRLWKSPGRTQTKLIKLIDKYYAEEEDGSARLDVNEEEQLLQNKERLEHRKKTLLELCLDGTISKEQYVEMDQENTAKLEMVDAQLQEFEELKSTQGGNAVNMAKERISGIKDILRECANISKKSIDKTMVQTFVDRIVPHEDNCFDWYIDLTASGKSFEERTYVQYSTFKLTFDEAKAYRNQCGNFIRISQWRSDLRINIFLCIQ